MLFFFDTGSGLDGFGAAFSGPKEVSCAAFSTFGESDSAFLGAILAGSFFGRSGGGVAFTVETFGFFAAGDDWAGAVCFGSDFFRAFSGADTADFFVSETLFATGFTALMGEGSGCFTGVDLAETFFAAGAGTGLAGEEAVFFSLESLLGNGFARLIPPVAAFFVTVGLGGAFLAVGGVAAVN